MFNKNQYRISFPNDTNIKYGMFMIPNSFNTKEYISGDINIEFKAEKGLTEAFFDKPVKDIPFAFMEKVNGEWILRNRPIIYEPTFEHQDEDEVGDKLAFTSSGTPPNIKFQGRNIIYSEFFTDLKAYRAMFLLYPLLSKHIKENLEDYGYKVKYINIDLAKDVLGWSYFIDFDISFNPFILKEFNIFTVFEEQLSTMGSDEYYNFFKKDKTLYSYYNIISGAVELLESKNTKEIKEIVTDFYNNSLRKDWKIL